MAINETLSNIRGALAKMMNLIEELGSLIKGVLSDIDAYFASTSFMPATEYLKREKTEAPRPVSDSAGIKVESKRDEDKKSENIIDMPIFSERLGINVAKITSNGELHIKFFGEGLPFQDKVTQFLLKKLSEYEPIIGKIGYTENSGQLVEIKFEIMRKPTGTELKEIARKITWAIEKIATRV